MIFLIGTMAYFSIRGVSDPFWALLMYYGLAVLRPQAIWQWVLPEGVRWSLIGALIAIATAIFCRRQTGEKVMDRRMIAMILMFCACLLGSYLMAMDQDVAGTWGWEYAKILIMMLVSYFVISQRWHFRYLAWTIVLCLAYLTFEVNSLYIFEGRIDIWSHGYSGLDNNGAGLMLAMLIPFLYFFFLAESRWFRWVFVVAALATAHAVMLTYSRGAMLSSIIAGAGMILTSSKQRLRSLIVGGLVGVLALAMAGPAVRDRFMTINESDRDASAQSRLGSWQAGWDIAKDFPVFGCGIRNSNLISKAYGADMQGRTIHDVYIQIAADCGFPAAAIYISMILCSLWWFRKAGQEAALHLNDKDIRWHYYICTGAFWSMVLFSIGTVFLSMEVFELPYLLMLMGACAVNLSQPDKKSMTGDTAIIVSDPQEAIEEGART